MLVFFDGLYRMIQTPVVLGVQAPDSVEDTEMRKKRSVNNRGTPNILWIFCTLTSYDYEGS